MVLRFQDMRCIKVGYNGNVDLKIHALYKGFLRNREALSFCIYVVAIIIFNKSKTKNTKMYNI